MVKVQIYDLPVRNVEVVEVEGVAIDLNNLGEVIVGQVDGASLVGQKFKKSVRI